MSLITELSEVDKVHRALLQRVAAAAEYQPRADGPASRACRVRIKLAAFQNAVGERMSPSDLAEYCAETCVRLLVCLHEAVSISSVVVGRSTTSRSRSTIALVRRDDDVYADDGAEGTLEKGGRWEAAITSGKGDSADMAQYVELALIRRHGEVVESRCVSADARWRSCAPDLAADHVVANEPDSEAGPAVADSMRPRGVEAQSLHALRFDHVGDEKVDADMLQALVPDPHHQLHVRREEAWLLPPGLYEILDQFEASGAGPDRPWVAQLTLAARPDVDMHGPCVRELREVLQTYQGLIDGRSTE